MSLFTVCLIACASVNDTDSAETHWRLLWLDINFTPMCPRWAFWVHEWMNAHSHTATKPQFDPLLNISLSLTLLPLPLCWQLNWEWNVTLPYYLHGDWKCAWLCVCTFVMSIPFSLTQTWTHTQAIPGCSFRRQVVKYAASLRNTLICEQSNPFMSSVCPCETFLAVTANASHKGRSKVN